jgi:ribosomal protein L7/L12
MDFSQIQNLLIDPTKKIQAIKMYREQTGKGLKEAKEAIEHFQKTGQWEFEDNSTLEIDLEVIHTMILDGDIIPAIKLVQERTGKSLKKAKETVENTDAYKEIFGDEDDDLRLIYKEIIRDDSITYHVQHDFSDHDIDLDLELLNESSVGSPSKQLQNDDVFTKVFLFFGLVLTFILSVFGFLFYLGKF